MKLVGHAECDHERLCRYVRNTTARAFSVVASALGIPALLPFLKAVCQSKKSWQARHTGIKIVQQIAILLGCAVLPHLKARPPLAPFHLGASAECRMPYSMRFYCVLTDKACGHILCLLWCCCPALLCLHVLSSPRNHCSNWRGLMAHHNPALWVCDHLLHTNRQ